MRAVVIVKDGRVIVERYATGIGFDTPLFGYSMTKTVTSAHVGVLVGEGRLKVGAPAPVAAWRGAEDPQGSITLHNLLRMDAAWQRRRPAPASIPPRAWSTPSRTWPPSPPARG